MLFLLVDSVEMLTAVVDFLLLPGSDQGLAKRASMHRHTVSIHLGGRRYCIVHVDTAAVVRGRRCIQTIAENVIVQRGRCRQILLVYRVVHLLNEAPFGLQLFAWGPEIRCAAQRRPSLDRRRHLLLMMMLLLFQY